jgi:hypothetical protein
LIFNFEKLNKKGGGNAINSATSQMRPNKIGQVVKFHTPYPDEDPNQHYVILEIHFDVEKPRAQIQELNGGESLPSLITVLVEELELVEVETADLLGHYVTINKPDVSQATGKVVKVDEHKVLLDLSKLVKGVETNVWLTIEDETGKEHFGTLFVN